MLEYEAYRVFCTDTDTAPDETDFLAMLQDEADCIKRAGCRVKHGEAVNRATSRMVAWFKDARRGEYEKPLLDLPHFVATYRRAAVWCVLLATEGR
jgi:hypothetical protein